MFFGKKFLLKDKLKTLFLYLSLTVIFIRIDSALHASEDSKSQAFYTEDYRGHLVFSIFQVIHLSEGKVQKKIKSECLLLKDFYKVINQMNYSSLYKIELGSLRIEESLHKTKVLSLPFYLKVLFVSRAETPKLILSYPLLSENKLTLKPKELPSFLSYLSIDLNVLSLTTNSSRLLLKTTLKPSGLIKYLVSNSFIKRVLVPRLQKILELLVLEFEQDKQKLCQTQERLY